MKSLMMLIVTFKFWPRRYTGMIILLQQDGITGIRASARMLWFMFGTPGVVRKLIPAWFSYFLPSFHPWNHDDRGLIGLVDSDYADAIMPQTA